MGEDQFKGVQIYDVIQDSKLNYLFATNEGLFIFDYYKYEKIECDQAKSNAVFGFVKNEDGTIYCHNLNSQVFQIRGKNCDLFYELKEDEAGADISMAIADNGCLIIGAAKIIVLDKKGIVKDRYVYPHSYLGVAFVQTNKAVLFNMSNNNSVVSYSKNVFSIRKLNFVQEDSSKLHILFFYTIGNTSYGLDLKTKRQYLFDQQNMLLTPTAGNRLFVRTGSVRIYKTKEHVWLAGTLPGLVLLGEKNQAKSDSILYPDYFISDVFEDNEGNILLSTFDKGVLVIPDLKIPDVIHSFRDDPVTALYNDSTAGLILGTSKGKLLNYQNEELKCINNQGNRPIGAIYGSTNSDFVLFDDGCIRVYNKRTKELKDVFYYSLKDAVVISANEMYLGTNNGIFKTRLNGKGQFVSENLPGISQRIYSIEYDPIGKNLYASASNGLFQISSAGVAKKILYRNKDVFSTGLLWYNKKLYACTGKNGILIIENGRITDSIRVLVNGKDEVLKKISIRNNIIIGRSSNGLFQFDMKGKLLKQLHSIFGFSSKRVIDFTFDKNKLWVSHSEGVQEIDPDYIQASLPIPIIRIDEVRVNDQTEDLLVTGDFGSDQRKLGFVFSSPTLRNRESIHYYYKLVGYEKDWTVTNYADNEITYNALDAGNYVFMVKTENQGLFSAPVSYTFSISPPLYQRWWFIVMLVLVFLLIVYRVYRWQLKVQRKKSDQINELNASKLTAIQSQMNPHFIFNSLNSVQDLILKGDVEHSYTYITTFSNLVRRTLNYSEKDFIDFDQEIKLLELYLSLEKLRFKKDLEYEVIIKNVEDIMLPPLLVQPFIENALVHGLLHREGKKKLTITFELKDVLICTVEDNGVGREKAKMIKQRQHSEHESFSGRAIRKRFEILSSVFGGEFGYTYEDLYQDNLPTGTKVILMIPVKRKF